MGAVYQQLPMCVSGQSDEPMRVWIPVSMFGQFFFYFVFKYFNKNKLKKIKK